MKKVILAILFIITIVETQAQWSITGNTGTTPGTNFLGTTDDKDLIFKRFNIQAGYIGVNSTSLGVYALRPLSTGAGNSAFGAYSLYSNTTGPYNTATGLNSMFTNSTGGFNTGTGYQSLYNNTTGGGNSAFGYATLSSNTIGNYNTAIGIVSLFTNSSGGFNTATGYQSLYNNTTGSGGAAFGYAALSSNTTGGSNTATGNQALFTNSTGSNNTAVGSFSLYTNGIGVNNTGLGNSAGFDNTTGVNNTYLGNSTGRGITTGSNNTIIGANVTGLTAGLSNNVIIADGSGNRRINIDATGKVGIGNTAPTQALDVTGNIYTNSKILIGTSALLATAYNNYSLAVNGWAVFTKAVVKLSASWPDYVFETDYKLPALKDVETFLIDNKHLPDMPTATDVEKNGIDLGDTQTILLKKVEELTLYMIALNKKVDALIKENEILKQ